MSVGYTSVQWNRQKRIYDLCLLALILLGVMGYVAASLFWNPRITAETLIIRSAALTAFGLMSLLLAIGPLSRLDSRFLPLLYNRRHLGVAIFLLALVHAVAATIQFHAFSDTNPLVSLFTAYRREYDPVSGPGASLAHFPFEPLGALALGILFLMAATSHDFWLKNLGAPVWKLLHLSVFVAYGLLVGHIGYGALQSETSPAYVMILAVVVGGVLALHVVAAQREAGRDRRQDGGSRADGFVPACRVDEVQDGRGKTVIVGGERIAIFRHGNRIFGISNVCRHQGGPLGEGRIIDGCITCPWHGWQYRPQDGMSPPPFTEVVATYRVRTDRGEVLVDPRPAPLGTDQPGVPVSCDELRTDG